MPCTVWAPPVAITNPQWRTWLTTTLHNNFLPPGGRAIDLTEQVMRADSRDAVSHPGLTAVRGVRIRPVFDRPTTAQVHHDPAPNDPGHATESTGDGATTVADLVIVDLGTTAADRRLGHLAARALRRDGILAVLTRCGPTAGGHDDRGVEDVSADGTRSIPERPTPWRSVLDPTNSVVASAEDAGLTYLQHIVIPTSPLTPPVGDNAAATRTEPKDTVGRIAPAHIDLHVFLNIDGERTGYTAPPDTGPASVQGFPRQPSRELVENVCGQTR